MAAPESDPRRVIRRLNLFGLATVATLIGGIGVWASTSQLSGAIIAPGSLVVESSVKKVQHPSGGIVGALMVDEGSSVQAGEVLMKLDDTIPRATLGVVRSELDAQLLREARLIAERDGLDSVDLPESLEMRRNEDAVAKAYDGEKKLFANRQNRLAGQRAQLNEQVVQLNEQIKGLEAQLTAKDSEIRLVQQELSGVTELYAKNLVSVTKLTDLQRSTARLEGERGQLVAATGAARGRISETELEILQLEENFLTGVLNDLRDADAKISELRQRQTAAEDQLLRIEIRAPQSGFVHELAVHTVGGVIGAGETVMLIVPRADELVVDARIAPADIDQVTVGANVSVRITAGNRRTMPMLRATVTRISADLFHEAQTGVAYYQVRMAFAENEIEKLGELRLLPGMPAETYVETEMRTPLDYLLKPLREQIARSFRER